MIIRTLALIQLILLIIASTAHAQQRPAGSVEQYELILVVGPGVADIEAGRIAASIERLRGLQHVSYYRADVSNNLCAAYILIEDLELAEAACNRAVGSRAVLGHYAATSNNADVAYNNRGVLRALQGDLEGAASDFRHASEMADHPASSERYAQRQVPNENLAITERRLAAMGDAEQRRQAAVRSND